MGKYAVTVVDLPVKHLVGVRKRSNMAQAGTDCPALWQNFGPRIDAFMAKGGSCLGAYGVSVMVDAASFDYWAAIETAPADAPPEGTERIDLPAGRYAVCRVPNLQALGEVYMFVYQEWSKEQSAYTVHCMAPSFEAYPKDWQMTDAFDVFIPVVAR